MSNDNIGSYSNLSGVLHSDIDNIKDYKKVSLPGLIPIIEKENTEDIQDKVQLSILKLHYNNGTTKYIRVFHDYDMNNLLDDKQKDNFFFKRLFGNDGLIVKEKRNDYLYLGGWNKDKTRITRGNKASNGEEKQNLVNIYVRDKIYPNINLDELFIDDDRTYMMKEPFDIDKFAYYFHLGNAPKDEVFQNGLKNRYDGSLPFPSLLSTFAESDKVLNNLIDATRLYGKKFNKGSNVFVLAVPLKYKSFHRIPIPFIRLDDYAKGMSTIIPELIYGMYDTQTGLFYKNSNYNPKFNPNGLTYDDTFARKCKDQNEQLYNDFILPRAGKNYDELLKEDLKNKTFASICQQYGIDIQDSQKSVLVNILDKLKKIKTKLGNDIGRRQ